MTPGKLHKVHACVKIRLVLPVLVFSVFFLINTANASDEEHVSFPQHSFAVFVGGGVEKEHGHSESGTAVGFKYDLRFHEKWSIGASVEKLYGSGPERTGVVAIPLSFQATENWRIFLGPGFEVHDKKDKALIRLGVAYEWELKNHWHLAPEIMVDFIDGGAKTYVFGIAFGRGF
jgi:hypothetical protein